MANKKSLLQEAIADAKEMKQIAFENAKAAMTETFTPELKKMINASLREELEEEYAEKSSEEMDEKVDKNEYPGSEEDHGGKKEWDVKKEAKRSSSEEEKGSEEEVEEHFDLDELLKELESEEEMRERKESSEEEVEEGKDEESDAPPGKNDDAEYQVYLKLRKKFEPETNEAEGGSEEEQPESGEEEQDYDIDEDSVEAIIRELEAEEDPKFGKSEEDGKPMDEKKFASSEDGKGKPLDEKKKMSSEEEKKASSEDMKSEVSQLKHELNEINLLNAKLLYFGKLVKEHDNLSKSEKIGLLKQFDKASNVKEVKLIHSTISESLKSNKAAANKAKKQIKESLGLSSKASGNSTKKKETTDILNENSMYNRFQILAGLKRLD